MLVLVVLDIINTFISIVYPLSWKDSILGGSQCQTAVAISMRESVCEPRKCGHPCHLLARSSLYNFLMHTKMVGPNNYLISSLSLYRCTKQGFVHKRCAQEGTVSSGFKV